MSASQSADTKAAADAPVENMTFEQAMSALEQIVGQLESGRVDLEQSIAIYERGAALRKHCEAKLRAAEMKVEEIVKSADGAAQGSKPFDQAG